MDSNEFHKEFDYGTIEEIVNLIKVNKSDFHVANSAIRKLTKKKKLSYSKIMQFVRILLSGRNEGPPVKDMIELLGVDESIVRLDIGLEFYL
jgi:glutamyl/glutaminyl-tRNA synthetase